MSIEKNRSLVLEFYDLMSKLEFKKMFDLLTDDATWTVVGNPQTFWPAGRQSKTDRAVAFAEFSKVFTRMQIDIVSSTAEDDRVALEAKTKATTNTGLVYENEFLLMFRCRENKIVSVHEFLDQQAVLSFVGALEAQRSPSHARSP